MVIIKEIPPGPDDKKCVKKRVDRGDGTFAEKEVCSEGKKQCTYTVNQWVKAKELTLKGGLSDEVKWPQTTVTGGDCIGCTREASRSVRFYVKLLSADSKGSYDNPERWRVIKPDAQYSTEVNLLGSLNCEKIK